VKGALYFDLRTDYDTTSNLFSELRLFFKSEHKATTLKTFTLQVYEIVKGKENVLVAEKGVTRNEKNPVKWVAINVTKVVTKWLRYPTLNHGLYVRAKNERGKLVAMHRVGLITSDSDTAVKKQRPFVVVLLRTETDSLLTDKILTQIKSKNKSRKKRDVDFTELMRESRTKQMIRQARIKFKAAQEGDKPTCRGVPFRIDFSKMNWDHWVLAPANYVSQRCDGSCSFPIHSQQNATSHALIQSLQNLMSGGKFPEPCCAPYEMSPLHIFLLDKYGNAVIKEYHDMRVDSCGCQ